MSYIEQREELLQQIQTIHDRKGYAAVGIDGRCTSGKSTLAAYLTDHLHASLIHMDDFFLRPEQRTPERYAMPGGNVDFERFIEEVLIPLQSGKPFAYYPFDCRSMQICKEPVSIPENSIVIIEGSYSMRPELKDFYDLKVFLHVDPETQMRRVEKRNPDKIEAFRTRWIPYEEKYFAAYHVLENCDVVIDTSSAF